MGKCIKHCNLSTSRIDSIQWQCAPPLETCASTVIHTGCIWVFPCSIRILFKSLHSRSRATKRSLNFWAVYLTSHVYSTFFFNFFNNLPFDKRSREHRVYKNILMCRWIYVELIDWLYTNCVLSACYATILNWRRKCILLLLFASK